jgi:hypothetical protein
MALDTAVWKAALKPMLESGLKSIYRQMHDEDVSKDDGWFAEQLAELISDAVAATGTDQIKTAGVPAGTVIVSVAGQAVGTPNAGEITVK